MNWIFGILGVVFLVLIYHSAVALYHAFRYGNEGDATHRIAYFFIGISVILLCAEGWLIYMIYQNNF